MKTQILKDISPNVQSALEELREMILEHFPEATFSVFLGIDDPSEIFLQTVVDIEDTDQVIDLVINRLIELQVEERLPIYVLPIRPLERVLKNTPPTRRHGSSLSFRTPLSY